VRYLLSKWFWWVPN
jgi:hypothetical protein